MLKMLNVENPGPSRDCNVKGVLSIILIIVFPGAVERKDPMCRFKTTAALEYSYT